jgi:Sir2- and TIR-associating SLOG family/SIR2-like domain
MTVSRDAFTSLYQQALDDGVAAAFVGAGLSVPAGFVDWKGLLREIATELDLDVDEETDLVALAQYHYNHARSRGRINQKLIDEYTKGASPTENHHLLARLPLASVWTTNYDHLIEEAFKAACKRVDKKVAQSDLAVTKPKRDVVVYKMHGDADSVHDAVLTKADYERYDDKRHLFSIQLKGDLVSKTMLFLGYSFSDPNVHYILARIRSLVGENVRPHYWVTRDANKNPQATARDRKLQRHRIEDLKTYGIRTVLVDEYSHITDILRHLSLRVHRKNVFISGSAHDYAPIGQDRALRLLRRLGAAIIDAGFNLVSGMGLGVGDAVAMGAIEAVYRQDGSHLDERTILRPFPQTEPTVDKRETIWTRYREEMLSLARSAIIVFGNKDNGSGKSVLAEGVREEFNIALRLGVLPIPVGLTEHTARELSLDVLRDLDRIYGAEAATVRPHLEVLADSKASDDAIIDAVITILKLVAPR